MKTRHKRILWVAGIIFITVIAVFYFFVKWLHFGPDKDEENELKFDKFTWVHFQTRDSENARHYMLGDLENNYLKRGMDSLKVIKLLGKPDGRFGFSYNLGIYDSPFDPTFLIIEFDKNGKLVKTSVETI